MTALMRRLLACVESWPEAETGGYDPRCCRFPKSCSATVYDEELVADENLEPAAGSLVLDEEHPPPSPLPEPPDGTRIEFEHWTDVYAAWRDDDSSARAGWTAGDGGQVWCLYGETVPKTWDQMWALFGDALRTAVRLVPVAEDEHLREQWPTTINAKATTP